MQFVDLTEGGQTCTTGGYDIKFQLLVGNEATIDIKAGGAQSSITLTQQEPIVTRQSDVDVMITLLPGFGARTVRVSW